MTPIMDYVPEPIDTSGVQLDAEVRTLLEQLARNTHEIWAQQRFSDGWRYGPRRDDERREHPGLVPYEQLSEEEKEYDRNTALAVLETIAKLGYRIEPVDAGPAVEMVQTVSGLLQQAADPKAGIAALVALWRGRDPTLWSRTPEIYTRVSDRLLMLGSPIVAHEMLDEALERWPRHVRLRQLQGLALARLGITDRAQEVLHRLYEEGKADEETMGMLARTYKDRALAGAGEERREALHRAHGLYVESYRRFGGYWTAVNAATTAMLLDDRGTAHALARQVLERCRLALEMDPDPYWPAATLGEAYLILEDRPQAAEWYGKAGEIGRNRLGALTSTRRNAQLLLEHLGEERTWIDRFLPVPRVMLFAGHMIDRPGRSSPRFPPEVESAVAGAIADRVRRFDGRVGFASAACGSDILFLEAVGRLGGETHIVLPAEPAEFARESVDVLPGADWPERFRLVLERAAEQVITAGQVIERGGLAYEYANMVLLGLAEIRARQLGTELIPLAVWDGKPGDAPGGTASAVERWQRLGYRIEVIDIAEIVAHTRPARTHALAPAPAPVHAPSTPSGEQYEARLSAVLFADVVKFSRLSEAQIPAFVEHFLGGIGCLTRELIAYKPVGQNTWGDGLYLVFDHVRDAGLYALELCRLAQDTDWTQYGLPAELNLRVGLHAGPVYRCRDPITGATNFIGTHVSRGARIEPVTPPGQVYASQAFAALASVERIREFECEYVRRVEWAKRYGAFPTYVVRRR
jgi:class 3 adenylate cyclase/tetratricopeptide (TPR) repeat protein